MLGIDQIYREYFSDVYKYLLVLTKNEHLAEEITQETFFKALRSIDKFKGDCSVYSWLCQIAKNTYFTHLKKEKKADKNTADNSETYIENGFFQIEDSESAFLIHSALHNLDEPYKEVFYLKFFTELSYNQIAQLFNKSESWARVTYHRAKLKLKEKLL